MRDQVAEAGGDEVGVFIIEVHDHNGSIWDEGEGGYGDEISEAMRGEGGDDVAVGAGGLVVGGFDLDMLAC